MLKSNRLRKLGAESLENKTLLHGGGFVGPISDVSIDDMVQATFERYDATQDGILNADDELSDRFANRIADADTDGDGGVSTDELTVHLETERVSKLLGLDDARCRPGVDVETRVTSAIETVDDDGEGDIDQAEVSESLWSSLSVADADEDGSLTAEELTALVEANAAAARAEMIANRVDAMFERYDTDADDLISVGEVTTMRWNRLSAADADGDQAVSRDELTQYVTDQVSNANDSDGANDPGFGGHGHGGHGHGHGRRGGRG